MPVALRSVGTGSGRLGILRTGKYHLKRDRPVSAVLWVAGGLEAFNAATTGFADFAYLASSRLAFKTIMSKCLRTFRFAFLTATLLFLSFVPTRAQQIQLEIASAMAIRNVVGDPGVSVTLSPESRVAFAAFSKEAARRFIEIRSGGDVLAIVSLQTPIEGGLLQFMVRDGSATEVARKLSENGTRLEVSVVEEKK
jgi:hypothetical protein